MLDWMKIVERGIYFIFSEESISHISVSIAEGLDELGITIFANQDCWPSYFKNGEYLFKHDENIHPNDCAICVADISNIELTMSKGKVHPLFLCADQLRQDLIIVLLDMGDTENLVNIDNNNLMLRGVLKTHLNKILEYPNFYFPWAFGLNKRIIQSTERALPFGERKQEIISIFRSSLNQSVRIAMNFAFLSNLQQKIKINDDLIQSEINTPYASNSQLDNFYAQLLKNHHMPNWFKILRESKFCCAYGGNFECANLTRRFDPENIIRTNIVSGGIKPKSSIMRWDSWRFWESLAAGCVTIHLDFEQCGFLLPVQPVNWQHYVGIDLTNPKATAERILDEPELMEEIAENGRQWALDHYSPVPVACRLLDIALGEELGTTQTLVSSFS